MSLITLPYVFNNGQTLPAGQLNSDFQTMYNDYNGNIANVNISSTAAIGLTKLAGGGAAAQNSVIAGPVSGGPGPLTIRVLTLADISGSTPLINNCRMYTQAGSPLALSSGASSTLFFGPCYSGPTFGNAISLPSGGTSFVTQTIAETAITMSGLTIGAIYDVYVTSASTTTATISTAVWTGNTPPTRGTLLGVITNVAQTGLWVGAFVAVSATTTQDDTSAAYVSNAFNPIKRKLFAYDATASRTTASATFVSDDGNTTNGQGRFAYLQAQPNYPVSIRQSIDAAPASASTWYSGIGINSTTTASVSGGFSQATAGFQSTTTISYINPAATGIVFVQRLIAINSGATLTVFAQQLSTNCTYTEGEIFN